MIKSMFVACLLTWSVGAMPAQYFGRVLTQTTTLSQVHPQQSHSRANHCQIATESGALRKEPPPIRPKFS